MYYGHILERDRNSAVSTQNHLRDWFPKHEEFYRYFVNFNKIAVLEAGCINDSIQLPVGEVQTTVMYRCMLDLMKNIFVALEAANSLISFNPPENSDGSRTYRSPWDIIANENYTMADGSAKIVLIEFYSDGSTVAKSRAQMAIFLRVLFANIDSFSDKWFKIGISPTTKVLLSTLPDDKRRYLKSNLMERIIFHTFLPLIKASYTGCIVEGTLL